MAENHEPVCLKDFVSHAERKLSSELFMFYQEGATDEFTLVENERAFKRFFFLPRMLRNVSKRNLKCNLLGSEIEHPFGIAPTASHKIAHLDGELATAKAAAITGTPMILSCMSSATLEEVADCYRKYYNGKQKTPLWFQMFCFEDENITIDLIKRAEQSGYTALVFTIDTPFMGRRYNVLRSKFTLPSNIKLSNLVNYKSLFDGGENLMNVSKKLDSSLTWDKMISFLRSSTNLPIVVKGVLTVEDAKKCVFYGVNGIIISNHGGRQLDSVPSTIECLARISQHIPPTLELYMDGGVRNGGDVLKALALGAKAVFVGRPVLWALSYGGSDGVQKMINILRTELDSDMALSGMTDVNNISRELIIRAQL